jgi:hypothetical protein
MTVAGEWLPGVGDEGSGIGRAKAGRDTGFTLLSGSLKV